MQVKQLVHLSDEVLHVGITSRLVGFQIAILCRKFGKLSFQLTKASFITCVAAFFNRLINWFVLIQLLLSLLQFRLKMLKLLFQIFNLKRGFLSDEFLLFERFR